MSGAIHIGTSGFHYKDWVGPVYPAGTSTRDFFELYCKRFSTVEVNYTFYRLPSTATMKSLADRSPEGMRAVVKLTGIFTHQRTGTLADARSFEACLAPLREQGKLGPLLAQFPYSFKPDKKSFEQIKRLRSYFRHPMVVEIRNRRWVTQRFFEFLKELELGFCCVDEPPIDGLLPPLNVVTSDVGYLRFHGRNSAKWWEHERPEERYDYLYEPSELAPWVPRLETMKKRAKETFVFFNNHFEGKAVQNAEEMIRLLQPARSN